MRSESVIVELSIRSRGIRAASGLGSLGFGRLFDHAGISILVPLTIISALFAPPVFLGNYWLTLIGSGIWGLGMGVHESIIPAAVALMVAPIRRRSAYGIFTSIYGVAWFVGSAIIGIFYDRCLLGVWLGYQIGTPFPHLIIKLLRLLRS